jgi:hypothetical protein
MVLATSPAIIITGSTRWRDCPDVLFHAGVSDHTVPQAACSPWPRRVVRDRHRAAYEVASKIHLMMQFRRDIGQKPGEP